MGSAPDQTRCPFLPTPIWTTTGWTEQVNAEGPMIEGPIWWLPEGIWSKAKYLKDQILPEFLATDHVVLGFAT